MSLRDIRDEHALSLRELAARARLTKATIVNIEAGRVQPHPSTVRKLAAAAFTTCAAALRFGGSSVNLGDIATGRVKAIIDCLWPILGGRPGAPDDGRVTTLEVEKGIATVPNGAVEILLRTTSQ